MTDERRIERPERDTTSPSARRAREERITSLAAGQHGIITRAQLLEIGVSPGTLGRRLRSGSLRALHRGVYLVGPIESQRALEMAAVLAGGPTSALSHTNALALWELLRIRPSRRIHVTVPGGGRDGRPGIVFHRADTLADDEYAVVDGIKVTAPGRTIVDVAGMLGSREIELALAVAEREGLLGSEELAGLPERYPRRPGMAMIRALVGEQIGPNFTRSVAEQRCLNLLAAARLPQPHTNVSVGPYELDIFWPEAGVAIEIDGWQHHSSRPRFEGDRRKDSWLRSHGIEVVRLTWRQITRDATATAVQVGQILALAKARQPGANTVPVSPVVRGQSRRRQSTAR